MLLFTLYILRNYSSLCKLAIHLINLNNESNSEKQILCLYELFFEVVWGGKVMVYKLNVLFHKMFQNKIKTSKMCFTECVQKKINLLNTVGICVTANS